MVTYVEVEEEVGGGEIFKFDFPNLGKLRQSLVN